ncbi:probable phosphoglycerate mutase [Streptomyces sp. LamerLS-316]|uniref:histidine phosphatase family protein n=1 Tax=unclassified Streptomyces TaxID=2593676 RepID=UPI000823B942|nr:MULTISPECIES: histidine phosphatase family protein [unclassified Streptomyces]MYQ43220.1 histidine phosphatase family protein [Streptomyces sp. SID4921]SCK35344.1 probable phosphoglycerate mutase [Streptomyces sp. LamerLS-316]
MTATAPRLLYIARHAQASPDETELTEQGRRQAVLLGERLRGIPLSAVHHGPLPRAAQTARLVHEQLGGDIPLRVSEPAGDYVPYAPRREELPEESADRFLAFVEQFPEAERARGPELADAAIARFTGPADGEAPRHELVVTHAFLAAWLVRDALDAPAWRWLGLNHANAALTVIRYAPGRPAALLMVNDMGHLPEELRWTGFPPELRV